MGTFRSLPLAATLPTPRTRLIGREVERAQGRAFLLDEAVPLLTLIGPGGVGKTRLAIALAQGVAEHFADGVVWVDLSPLTDPALLATTLATALALPSETPQSPRDAVLRQLRPRQTLAKRLRDLQSRVRAEHGELPHSTVMIRDERDRWG